MELSSLPSNGVGLGVSSGRTDTVGATSNHRNGRLQTVASLDQNSPSKLPNAVAMATVRLLGVSKGMCQAPLLPKTAHAGQSHSVAGPARTSSFLSGIGKLLPNGYGELHVVNFS